MRLNATGRPRREAGKLEVAAFYLKNEGTLRLHFGSQHFVKNNVLRAFCGYICFHQVSHGFAQKNTVLRAF